MVWRVLAGSAVVVAPSLDDRRTGVQWRFTSSSASLATVPGARQELASDERCVILENAGLSNHDTIDASDLGGHAR